MRKLAALLLLLMLSGCWIGADFYGAADLRQPLPAGDYQLTELTKGLIDEGRLRIAHRRDGYVTATPIDARGREDSGDVSTIGFAQLDAEGRLFVAWQMMGESGAPANERSYALLRREPSGVFTAFLPRCWGRESEAARAAGATIDPPESQTVCVFSGRMQLEAALRVAEPHMQPILRLSTLPR